MAIYRFFRDDICYSLTKSPEPGMADFCAKAFGYRNGVDIQAVEAAALNGILNGEIDPSVGLPTDPSGGAQNIRDTAQELAPAVADGQSTADPDKVRSLDAFRARRGPRQVLVGSDPA